MSPYRHARILTPWSHAPRATFWRRALAHLRGVHSRLVWRKWRRFIARDEDQDLYLLAGIVEVRDARRVLAARVGLIHWPCEHTLHPDRLVCMRCGDSVQTIEALRADGSLT